MEMLGFHITSRLNGTFKWWEGKSTNNIGSKYLIFFSLIQIGIYDENCVTERIWKFLY